MLEFDHVIVAVRDLAAAAERFHAQYGLASLPGGRHTGLGTGNRIVPLGAAYVELMAVVDEEEAAASALAAWVGRMTEAGDRLAAVCLRTNDIEGAADRLDTTPIPMQRAQPDGVVLTWRLAGLADTLEDPSLPFFIQWDDVPIDQLPGNSEAPHLIEPLGIDWVEIAQDPQKIHQRTGADHLNIRIADGTPGLRAVGIATTDGVVTITG
ncbi:MAG: VOC family protein [Actinomycetota bacterium]